jgi:Zn-dependent membrane protease YugP
VDIFWLILGGAYLLSLVVQKRLRATHQKWGSIRNSANMTGAETARTILDANDLRRVDVRAVRGQLSDHYDPRDTSVQLSESVFNVPSVAAMAVAAHETGHAIQDAVNYSPLEVRTALAPVVNTAARFGIPAAIIGVFTGAPLLTQMGAVAYVVALAFQFLTLPVEFDASKRALTQLDQLRLLNAEEKEGARSMLRAAAMTYVAGAASSAAYVLYLVLLVGRWAFKIPAPVPPPRLP